MKERNVGNHVDIKTENVSGVEKKGCAVDKDGLGKDAMETLVGVGDTSARKSHISQKSKMKESNVGGHVDVKTGNVIGVEQKACVVDRDHVGLNKDAMVRWVGNIDMSAQKYQMLQHQVYIFIYCSVTKRAKSAYS